MSNHTLTTLPFLLTKKSNNLETFSCRSNKQKYNVDSIEEYHVDIGLYTCAKKLEESWYVVNIYPETSEYDLYSVWINCMTGEIILDDFAKHSLG